MPELTRRVKPSRAQDDFQQSLGVLVKAVEPVATVLELRDGGEEGFDADFSAGDGFDGLGVFAGGGTAAKDAEFTRDESLEGKGDLRLEIADTADAAALADGLHRDLDGGTEADDFDGVIGAVGIADKFAHLGGDVITGPEGGVGAEFLREGEAFFIDVDGDDKTGALGFEGLDDEESDEAGADDDGGISGFQWEPVDAVEGDGDGFGEGGVLVGKIARDGVEDVFGDADEFGEGPVAAVVAAGDAEDVAIRTEVDLAGEAGGALSAVDGGVEGDAVADLPLPHGGSDLGNFAGGFVSHDDGGNASSRAAVHAVDVGSADATGLHRNEHFVLRDLRVGGVTVFELVVGGEGEGFHGRGNWDLMRTRKRKKVPHQTEIRPGTRDPDMKAVVQGIFLLLLALLLVQCETIDSGMAGTAGSVTVAGTMFYPDEKGITYRVPAGAQIIGSGGTDCVFIIESGGSVVAHSGTGNSYRVKSGGQFRGFAHPATNCTVTYEAGAVIEQEQTGPGTTFVGS